MTVALLGTDDVRRIKDAVRRVNGSPQGGEGRARGPIMSAARVAPVRVTSTTTTDGYYPAELVRWNTSTRVWDDLTGAQTVWLRFSDVPGSAAVDDVYPNCVVVGVRPEDGKLIFAHSGDEGISAGGGSLTVREVDLSPSISSVTVLEFNQTDGLIVSNPSAGRAAVSISDAGLTTVGIVTAGTQTFGGAKTFNAKTTFTSGWDASATCTLLTGNKLRAEDAASPSTTLSVELDETGIRLQDTSGPVGAVNVIGLLDVQATVNNGGDGICLKCLTNAGSDVGELQLLNFGSTEVRLVLVDNSGASGTQPKYCVREGGTLQTGAYGTINLGSTSAIVVKGGLITSWA